MTIRLRVLDLRAARGGETVAGPVSFTLSAGEALAITGENGAGKSTLLRTLAGLLAPDGGTVAVEGANAADGEPARRLCEIAHYVGHRNAMKAALPVGENLRFWHALLGGAEASVGDALDAVGLSAVEATPFGYLSAGQQRRAALARLLVASRPVWILDEPTAALDAGARACFAALLAAHLASGGIVLAATHQPLGIDARELRLEKRQAVSSFAAAGEATPAEPEPEGWS